MEVSLIWRCPVGVSISCQSICLCVYFTYIVHTDIICTHSCPLLTHPQILYSLNTVEPHPQNGLDSAVGGAKTSPALEIEVVEGEGEGEGGEGPAEEVEVVGGGTEEESIPFSPLSTCKFYNNEIEQHDWDQLKVYGHDDVCPLMIWYTQLSKNII